MKVAANKTQSILDQPPLAANKPQSILDQPTLADDKLSIKPSFCGNWKIYFIPVFVLIDVSSFIICLAIYYIRILLLIENHDLLGGLLADRQCALFDCTFILKQVGFSET